MFDREFYWALAHCSQQLSQHYVVPKLMKRILYWILTAGSLYYYALENVGYSMLTNFDAGVSYVPWLLQ